MKESGQFFFFFLLLHFCLFRDLSKTPQATVIANEKWCSIYNAVVVLREVSRLLASRPETQSICLFFVDGHVRNCRRWTCRVDLIIIDEELGCVCCVNVQTT